MPIILGTGKKSGEFWWLLADQPYLPSKFQVSENKK